MKKWEIDWGYGKADADPETNPAKRSASIKYSCGVRRYHHTELKVYNSSVSDPGSRRSKMTHKNIQS
jgi:hypothetical protein